MDLLIFLCYMLTKRNERKLVRSIRDQQDDAYHQSLKIDQEKEQKRKAKEAEDAIAKAKEDAFQLSRTKFLEKLARYD